jgi:ABC-2 type transport system ATP-binding protein
MYAIEASGIRKVFKEKGSSFWALKGITLDIRKGQAFGLLGPNGAGKTTLIHILSTLLIPTSGSASVLGYDVMHESNEVKKRIGICMGGANFYWDLNPREILKYFGMLYGLDSATRKKRIDHLLKSLGIIKFQGRDFGQLSTGMRQKVAVAKSLLNDPDVLFLDEPTAGLDVEVALEVRNYILDLIQEKDMTVLLTSHQMGEVEQMCKRIAIINQGNVIKDGRISEIKKSLRIHDIIHIHLDRYGDLDFLKDVPGVVHYGVSDALYITVESGKDAVTPVLSAFRKKKRKVVDLEIRKLSLEEVFLTVVGRRTSLPLGIREDMK